MQRGDRGTARRFEDDRGAAMVEMALVGMLLVFLLFGIVIFAYLMSFRSNMVQAAAEAARAGAVAPSGFAQTEATSAATRSVASFSQTCGSGGMVCDIPPPAACANNPTATCITVTLTYHYEGNEFLPEIPIISSFMPENIGPVSSVAEINS